MNIPQLTVQPRRTTDPVRAMDADRQLFRGYFIDRLRQTDSVTGQSLYTTLERSQPTVAQILDKLRTIQQWAVQGILLGRHVDLNPSVAAIPSLIAECIQVLGQAQPQPLAVVVYKLAEMGHPQQWASLFHVQYQPAVLDMMTEVVGELMLLGRLAIPVDSPRKKRLQQQQPRRSATAE